MRYFLVSIALCLGGMMTGCGKAPEPAATPNPQPAPPATVSNPAPKPPPSTMQTVVDGFTGKAVMEQGRATAEKVKAINAKEQAALTEAMQ
jgi:hypothetical protein